MKKGIVVIAVVAILAVAGVVIVMMLMNNNNEPVEVVRPALRIEYPLGTFTANLSGSRRIVRTNIVVIGNEEGLEEKINESEALINDTVIFILRDITESDMGADDIKDRLTERLISDLNDRLDIDNFVDVLFNELIMS